MSFANLKIGTRLALAFSVVFALLLAIVALSTAGLSRTAQTMDRVVSDRYAQIALSNTIKSMGDKGVITIGRVLLATEEAQLKKHLDDYAAIRSANAENLKKFESLLSSDETRAIFEEQTKARKEYGAVVAKVFELMKAGQREQAMAVYQNDLPEPQKKYYALIDKMVAHQADSMAEDVVQAQVSAHDAKLQMLVASLLAVVLGAVTAWAITRSVTRPIQKAIDLAEAVAAGNLTYRTEHSSRDEVGRLMTALQNMVHSLHAIVSQVRGGADTITSAAAEVSQGNHDLSNRTEQQASALQETASAMEQLTAAVKISAASADEASKSAVSASQIAVQGGEVVERVVGSMASIASSSKRIVEIIDVIDGIAFQTNILALNAAVEAARAGEQGRGFAVVAGEVRSLAQRSALAAKEIKGLIDASVSQVDEGSKMVEQAGATMSEVVASIGRVRDIVAEISAASREQSIGIEQVSSTVQQMDDSTQQNAAMVEQSSASARAMKEQAQQLTGVVSAFAL
ncbi:methyl-accepting chemotaxis protein [uncultured Aquincola sp.]|uniref:methyl-accepting chemotaxis protein n=1 Tax=uncultured Aquincola sp. TaxID=886556 RepID=UPI0032B1CB03